MKSDDVLFKDYAGDEKGTRGKGQKVKGASQFNIRVLLGYISADMKRKPGSYRIGIFTIVLVLTFIMVIWSAVLYASLVFLKLAQNTAGESDVMFSV